MNLLSISNFFEELFADDGLYLCLLAAMGVVTVLFIIIALSIPKKCFKKRGVIKEEISQKKQDDEQQEEINTEVLNQPEVLTVVDQAQKDLYDDEQVPTVKQVLGEAADEFDNGELVIESGFVNDGTGRAEPVLTFEQIINEVKETAAGTKSKKHRADKPKAK